MKWSETKSLSADCCVFGRIGKVRKQPFSGLRIDLRFIILYTCLLQRAFTVTKQNFTNFCDVFWPYCLLWSSRKEWFICAGTVTTKFSKPVLDRWKWWVKPLHHTSPHHISATALHQPCCFPKHDIQIFPIVDRKMSWNFDSIPVAVITLS